MAGFVLRVSWLVSWNRIKLNIEDRLSFLLNPDRTFALLENSESTLQILKISKPQKEDVTVGFEIDADGAVEGIDYNVIAKSNYDQAVRVLSIHRNWSTDNSVFESEKVIRHHAYRSFKIIDSDKGFWSIG